MSQGHIFAKIMTREQFIELMEYLESEKLRRSRRFRKRHFFEYDDIYHSIAQLSCSYIRYNRSDYHDENLSEDVKYLRTVREKLNYSIDLADDIGMMDIIEDYEQIIIEGMEYEDIPKEDIKALRELGETNPNGALLACFLKLKKKGSVHQHNYNDGTVRQQLKNLEGRIKRLEENFDEDSENSTSSLSKEPRKKRRWFKGLGKVAQGAALTLANVGLASGYLVLPVDASTQTWGAIVSSITGVGTALDGFGELRGE